MKREGVITAEAVTLKLGLSYRLDSLIDSFWARALQSDVFPVPGGPGQTMKNHFSHTHFRHFNLNG